MGDGGCERDWEERKEGKLWVSLLLQSFQQGLEKWLRAFPEDKIKFPFPMAQNCPELHLQRLWRPLPVSVDKASTQIYLIHCRS